MKRRNMSSDCEFGASSPLPRKRFARAVASNDSLPCKFKLVQAWQLTEEASQFISKANKMDEKALNDRSSPQMAVVLYEPNLYQNIIDAIAAAEASMYEPEPM